MVVFPSNQNFSFTEKCTLPYPTYEVDVVAVLNSVTTLFSKYFKNINTHPLQIENVYPSDDFPQTVYESYKIYLCIPPFDENGNPGCYWSQFIYQFSHEFCHYMNFGYVVQPMRWFEEMLCELASHFFLLKIAEQWAVSPPYASLISYSNSLHEYESSNRTDISSFDFSIDFPTILKEFEKDEYQRQYNRFIALTLLPMFIEKPSLWNIVPCLTDLSENLSFRDNLEKLSELSKENMDEIISVFYPLKE